MNFREDWKKTQLGKVLTFQRGVDLAQKQRKLGNIPIYAATGIVGTHNEVKVKFLQQCQTQNYQINLIYFLKTQKFNYSSQ